MTPGNWVDALPLEGNFTVESVEEDRALVWIFGMWMSGSWVDHSIPDGFFATVWKAGDRWTMWKSWRKSTLRVGIACHQAIVSDTADGRNPAKQLISSWSHYVPGFIHPRWLAAFLPSTAIIDIGMLPHQSHCHFFLLNVAWPLLCSVSTEVYTLQNGPRISSENPNDLYFWRSILESKPLFNQNKGHLGSRLGIIVPLIPVE